MADEFTLLKATERGELAAYLLRNELLMEAFDRLDAEYVKAWRDTPVRDTDARERYWQAAHIVAKVRGHLKHVVENGKVAQSQLNEIAKLGERHKLFGVV